MRFGPIVSVTGGLSLPSTPPLVRQPYTHAVFLSTRRRCWQVPCASRCERARSLRCIITPSSVVLDQVAADGVAVFDKRHELLGCVSCGTCACSETAPRSVSKQSKKSVFGDELLRQATPRATKLGKMSGGTGLSPGCHVLQYFPPRSPHTLPQWTTR